MTDSEIIGLTEKGRQIERLRAIVHRLRAPDGCPWDREQSHESLIPNLIEEAYEVIDAIRREDSPHLAEELGDLLLQVVFHAEIAEEAGQYDFDEVAGKISEKLIRRHPHVFAGEEITETAGVLTRWEEIKRQEKGESVELPYMHGVGEGLPSLLAAKKIQKKAAKVGFDWPDTQGVIDKIREELLEVEEEIELGDDCKIEEEMGDLLFATVNLARKLGKDPELMLHEANEKFKARFSAMEASLAKQGGDLKLADLDTMESVWQAVK